MSASPATLKQSNNLDDVVASAAERFRREANPDHDSYQRLFRRRGELEDGIVSLLGRLSARLPDYILVRSILGGDVITAEEIMVARPDIAYSDEQIATLAATIPSAEVLSALKADGYALMPQPPRATSLLDIRRAKSARSHSETEICYADQEFAKKDLTGTGWLALKKTLAAQNKPLIHIAQHAPNASKAGWFITIFFDVRGVWLFENVHILTSSIDSGGGYVSVGGSRVGGLGVGHRDYERYPLGFAPALEF